MGVERARPAPGPGRLSRPRAVADQLPLRLSPRERPGLDDYLGTANHLAVAAVRRALSARDSRGVYLWGPPATGKSHLLQAACAEAAGAMYLPLGTLAGAGPEVLDRVEEAGLVCLDDLDAVLGAGRWEEPLFHLFNRALLHATPVLVAARRAPAGCPVGLADLRSRLGALEVYGLRPPADPDLGAVLAACARRRGMRLPGEVVEFLLRHERRDLAWLLRVLEALEHESLRAQRPVTVPLLKLALARARGAAEGSGREWGERG